MLWKEGEKQAYTHLGGSHQAAGGQAWSRRGPDAGTRGRHDPPTAVPPPGSPRPPRAPRSRSRSLPGVSKRPPSRPSAAERPVRSRRPPPRRSREVSAGRTPRARPGLRSPHWLCERRGAPGAPRGVRSPASPPPPRGRRPRTPGLALAPPAPVLLRSGSSRAVGPVETPGWPVLGSRCRAPAPPDLKATARAGWAGWECPGLGAAAVPTPPAWGHPTGAGLGA